MSKAILLVLIIVLISACNPIVSEEEFAAQQPISPVTLEVDTLTPYLVGFVDGCIGMYLAANPNPPASYDSVYGGCLKMLESTVLSGFGPDSPRAPMPGKTPEPELDLSST